MFTLGNWSTDNITNPWTAGGRNAPFDREFYLIFNVAVGGTNSMFDDNQCDKPWLDKDKKAINAFWDNKA